MLKSVDDKNCQDQVVDGRRIGQRKGESSDCDRAMAAMHEKSLGEETRGYEESRRLRGRRAEFV